MGGGQWVARCAALALPSNRSQRWSAPLDACRAARAAAGPVACLNQALTLFQTTTFRPRLARLLLSSMIREKPICRHRCSQQSFATSPDHWPSRYLQLAWRVPGTCACSLNRSQHLHSHRGLQNTDECSRCCRALRRPGAPPGVPAADRGPPRRPAGGPRTPAAAAAVRRPQQQAVRRLSPLPGRGRSSAGRGEARLGLLAGCRRCRPCAPAAAACRKARAPPRAHPLLHHLPCQVGKLISKVEIPAFIPRSDLMDQLTRWALIEVQEDGVANIGCPCKVTPAAAAAGAASCMHACMHVGAGSAAAQQRARATCVRAACMCGADGVSTTVACRAGGAVPLLTAHPLPPPPPAGDVLHPGRAAVGLHRLLPQGCVAC